MNMKELFRKLLLVAAIAAPASSVLAESGSIDNGPLSVEWQTTFVGKNPVFDDRQIFFNLFPGDTQQTGSFSALLTPKDWASNNWEFVGAFQISAYPLSFDATRLILPQATMDYMVTRIADGTVVKDFHGQKTLSDSFKDARLETYFSMPSFSNNPSAYRFEGSFTFTPGTYTQPNYDPNCVGAACVLQKSDKTSGLFNIFAAAAVPEPAPWLFLSTGGLSLFAYRHSKIALSAVA